MSTVVYYRVVSTKLTEEEHGMLLDVCNVRGCPPSVLIRDAILDMINSERKLRQKIDPREFQTRESGSKNQRTRKEFPNSELEKLLGIR